MTEKRAGFQLPEIASIIWKMIADAGLKVGDRLPPERVLADTFQVSRGTVRRGIQSLAERGILSRRHGDGTYVSSVSEDEFVKESMAMALQVKTDLLAEVLEFRRILEPQTAWLAAGRIAKEDLDSLKVIVCNQQLQFGGKDGSLDAAFHLALAKGSGNRVLFRVMALINDILAESRTGRYQSEKRHGISVSGHLKVIEALEKKSREGAFLAMKEHIEQVEAVVIKAGKDTNEKRK